MTYSDSPSRSKRRFISVTPKRISESRTFTHRSVISMSTWFAIGVFLLGVGIGALLTTIAHSGQKRRLRIELETMLSHEHLPCE